MHGRPFDSRERVCVSVASGIRRGSSPRPRSSSMRRARQRPRLSARHPWVRSPFLSRGRIAAIGGQRLLEQLHQRRCFAGLGLAGETQAVSESQAGRRVGAAVGDDAPRQGLMGLDEDGIVQRDEGLQRRVRSAAADRADLAVRRVEGREARVRTVSLRLRVDAAR